MDPIASIDYRLAPGSSVSHDARHLSGVNWPAVIAGAFVIAAVSLTLLALGAGVGLSSVSPWAQSGASAVGWSAIAGLVLMQIVACSLGGYLAGRLRARWTQVHSHEVYFRDTAHGFLAWAVGLVLTAAYLTSAAATMAGGAAAGASAGAASARSDQDSGRDYLVDSLLRGSPNSGANLEGQQREVAAIFAHSLVVGTLPPADRTYLAQMVAARASVSQPEAERRVDEADVQLRQAAEATRKAIAHSLYWTFLALLVGAFTASVAATVGGKQRDHMPVV